MKKKIIERYFHLFNQNKFNEINNMFKKLQKAFNVESDLIDQERNLHKNKNLFFRGVADSTYPDFNRLKRNKRNLLHLNMNMKMININNDNNMNKNINMNMNINKNINMNINKNINLNNIMNNNIINKAENNNKYATIHDNVSKIKEKKLQMYIKNKERFLLDTNTFGNNFYEANDNNIELDTEYNDINKKNKINNINKLNLNKKALENPYDLKNNLINHVDVESKKNLNKHSYKDKDKDNSLNKDKNKNINKKLEENKSKRKSINRNKSKKKDKNKKKDRDKYNNTDNNIDNDNNKNEMDIYKDEDNFFSANILIEEDVIPRNEHNKKDDNKNNNNNKNKNLKSKEKNKIFESDNENENDNNNNKEGDKNINLNINKNKNKIKNNNNNNIKNKNEGKNNNKNKNRNKNLKNSFNRQLEISPSNLEGEINMNNNSSKENFYILPENYSEKKSEIKKEINSDEEKISFLNINKENKNENELSFSPFSLNANTKNIINSKKPLFIPIIKKEKVYNFEKNLDKKFYKKKKFNKINNDYNDYYNYNNSNFLQNDNDLLCDEEEIQREFLKKKIKDEISEMNNIVRYHNIVNRYDSPIIKNESPKKKVFKILNNPEKIQKLRIKYLII
jgi:hypothetical protein